MISLESTNSRKDKTKYQSQKILLREINRVAEAIEILKTDIQMFRHACTYFLAYERNYQIEDTHDFFEHTDSSMIKEREKSQIIKCIEDGFKEYYYPAKHLEIIDEIIIENPNIMNKINIVRDEDIFE